MLTREERERLRALEREATPGEWRVRPDEFDDWGMVRSEAGHLVAMARSGSSLTETDYDRHRANGTDPFEHNARLIAAARNALVPLLDHIDALEAELDETRKTLSLLVASEVTAAMSSVYGLCAQRADPTAQVEPCNGCGEPNDDGCDHCCQTCLGSEVCPSCGVLAKEVEDE